MAIAIDAAIRTDKSPVDRGLTVVWGLILSCFMGDTEEFIQ